VDPAGAADVAFSGVLPNGAVYTTPVESMTERRFRHLVRQQTDYSCGAASLATILKYAYHLDAAEAMAIEGMLRNADQERAAQRRVSLRDRKRHGESLGRRGSDYRVDEERRRSLRVTGIVLMDVNGCRHSVVLKQVIDDRVEVRVPIMGDRSVQIEQCR